MALRSPAPIESPLPLCRPCPAQKGLSAGRPLYVSALNQIVLISLLFDCLLLFVYSTTNAKRAAEAGNEGAALPDAGRNEMRPGNTDLPSVPMVSRVIQDNG